METKKHVFGGRCATSGGEIRNALWMAGWVLAWAVVWAGVSQGIRREWLAAGPVTYGAIGVSTLLGLGMIWGYWRYLQKADELQRKIQLEALALSLGAALVGSSTYRLLERAGLVASVDVSNVILVIAVVYSVAVIAGNWRYS